MKQVIRRGIAFTQNVDNIFINLLAGFNVSFAPQKHSFAKKYVITPLITDLDSIRHAAEHNSAENDEFRSYLKQQDSSFVDSIVHELNEEIAPQIDCTSCGNCCRSFMINVTQEEAEKVSGMLNQTVDQFKEKYIEESAGGQLIISEIPCHFLEGTICSIYSNRFSECREFPHLHKEQVQQRLFGLLMYYGTCPIIYNVLEQTKIRSGFLIPFVNETINLESSL